MFTVPYVRKYDDTNVIIVNGQCHRIYDTEYDDAIDVYSYVITTTKLTRQTKTRRSSISFINYIDRSTITDIITTIK